MYLFLVGQLHRWSAGGSASSLGKPERPFQMRLFLPAGPIAIIIKIILGYCPFQSSSQFFLFFWTGMETCSSHLVRKGSKKEGEKYGIFAIPEEVWIKRKSIVFSFLYFGSLFRVRFSLFQLGILNLHAIGSSLGTSYFPNTLCFDRFSPPVFHQFPISTVNQHLGISKLGSEIRIAGFNILQLSISRSGILIVLLDKFANTRYGYNLL